MRSAMLKQATLSRKPTMIDFNFHQIMSWQRAKTMLDADAIGALRHVAVHWHVESRAIQLRMRSWKTLGDDGGGVLGNFISHCFHYLEWFCGPISGLSARVSGLPDDRELETTVAMALQFANRAAGEPVDELRVLSRHRAPHRIFRRRTGRSCCTILAPITCAASNCFTQRGRSAFERIPVEDPVDAKYPDGRIAPVSRLARIFLDAIESGRPATPGFAEGHRVQILIDAARRSHQSGAWIDVTQAGRQKGVRA